MNIAYEICWPDGKIENGVGQAESFVAFKQQWKTKGAIVLQMSEVQVRRQGALFSRRTRMTIAQRCMFTRQLAGLVDAGLAIDKALLSLTRQHATSPNAQAICAIMQSLYDQVREGTSLSKAMDKYPHDFDASYRAVIAAAEQSGAMGEVLEQLASELEASQNLRSTLMSACLYPGIVSLFAVVMVLFLMTYVVPQVANVFANGNKTLPVLTSIMLGLSAFIRQWWWLAALMGAAGFVVLGSMYRKPDTGRRIDGWLLRIPVLGQLLRVYNTARFASTLSLLTKSGVPILKALNTAANTMGNRAMKYPLDSSLERVREGASVAHALEGTRVFPEELITFAQLGEKTGRLPEMLGRVAKQLGTDVSRKALSLAGIVEPLLIVTMGLVVMLIVLSVLLPIIDLNTMVR